MQNQKIKRVGGGFGAKGFMKAKNVSQQIKKKSKVIIPKPSFPQRLRSQKMKPIQKTRKLVEKKEKAGQRLKEKNKSKKDEDSQQQLQVIDLSSMSVPLQQQMASHNIQSQVLSLQIIQPQSIVLSQNILENRRQFIDSIASPVRNNSQSLELALNEANQRYMSLSKMYEQLQRQYNQANQSIYKSVQQSKQAQILYGQTIAAFQMVNKSRQQLIQFNERLTKQIQALQNRPPQVQYIQIPGLRDQFNRLKYQYEQLEFKNAAQAALSQKYKALESQYNKIRQAYERVKSMPRQTMIQYYPDLTTQKQLQTMRIQLNQLKNRPAQIQYITDTQFQEKYYGLLKQHEKTIKQLNKVKVQPKQPKIKIKTVIDEQQRKQYDALLQMFNQLKREYQAVTQKEPDVHYVQIPLENDPSYQNLQNNYNLLEQQYYRLRQQFVNLNNNPRIVTQFKTPQKVFLQKIVYKTPPQKIIFKTPEKKEPQKIYLQKWIDREVIKYKTPQRIFIQKWKTPAKSEMIEQPLVERIVEYVPQIHEVHIPGPQRIVQIPGPQRIIEVPYKVQVPVYVQKPQRVIYKQSQPIIFVDEQKIKELTQQRELLLKRFKQLEKHHQQVIQQKVELQQLNAMIQQQYNIKIDDKTRQAEQLRQTIDIRQADFKQKEKKNLARKLQMMKQAAQFKKKLEQISQQTKNKRSKIKQSLAKQIFKKQPSKKINSSAQWSTPNQSQRQVDALSVQRSPFHTPDASDGISDSAEEGQSSYNPNSSFSIEQQLQQDLSEPEQSLEKDFGNDAQLHNLGNIAIVCCWQRTRDQLWIGTKIARPTGYSYYTHQSVSLPRRAIQHVYSAFMKVKNKQKDQNGKAYSRIPQSRVYFIKDTYKQIDFIGLRRCIYYNKELCATRNGFNLLQSQFTDAMEHWQEVLQQLDFQ